jgi:choline dehydrogenase-like flavoprotein
MNFRRPEMTIAGGEYDAIVVGTGPGGASVAKELSQKNRRVLILEWGANVPENGKLMAAMRGIGVPFKNLLFTYNRVMMVRGTATGGSSFYNYATAFDPPLDLFKRYDVDLSEEVQETHDELPIAPLNDHLIGPMAKRMMDSAQDIGYEWHKLPKIIFQDKCRQQCWMCGYGCPYGAKWSARMHVEEAVRKGALLQNKTKVKKVIISGNHAEGIAYSTKSGVQEAKAPVIVLSAGGTGTPVILNNSGIKGSGKDFFFDPEILVWGIVNDLRGGREIPMSTGVYFEDDGYMLADMTITLPMHAIFTSYVGKFNKIFTHPKALTIMVKVKDTLHGFVNKRGGIRKKLTEDDRRKLLSGVEHARKILRNAGATDIFESEIFAAHPGGTAKIGDVVDKNLKTEFDNLYVCDTSVIPESWGLPPSITCVALGKRLAKHILNQPR